MHVFHLIFIFNQTKSTHTCDTLTVYERARCPNYSIAATNSKKKQNESSTVHHIYRSLNRLRKMVSYQTNECIQTCSFHFTFVYVVRSFLFTFSFLHFAFFLAVLARTYIFNFSTFWCDVVMRTATATATVLSTAKTPSLNQPTNPFREHIEVKT